MGVTRMNPRHAYWWSMAALVRGGLAVLIFLAWCLAMYMHAHHAAPAQPEPSSNERPAFVPPASSSATQSETLGTVTLPPYATSEGRSGSPSATGPGH